jgi:MFS transporter, DHA1 family, chloramphenicol resistance protein
MACQGYLIYAVGFITPFIRTDLGVPPWVAAMPNSAMALGLVGASVLTSYANARVGPRVAVRTWAALMAGAAVLLAIPLTIVPILLGALLFGASIGGTLVHVNSALGEGRRGSTLLVRANLFAVAGGLAGPLILSAAATGIGWWFGLLAPVPFLVALAFVLPGSPARDRPASGSDREAGLPRDYWLSWTFLTLLIGAEFSFVVWGSQVVAARVGISDVAATGLASLFVAGMVAGRLAMSTGVATPPRRLPVLRVATALAVAGAALTGLAARPELAGLGLLLGGLGISPAYPLGASLALGHAPGAPVRASARLTAASGVAIFSAPLGLGLVVSVVGVAGAWLVVLGMIALGLLLILRIPPPPVAVEGVEVAVG